MDTSQVKSLLAEIPYFSALSKDVWAKMVAQMKHHHLNPGDRLYRQGDRGESLAILAKGELRVVVALESGIEVALGLRREVGSVVGEMALLEGRPRSASVDAVTKADVWLLSDLDFFRVLDDNPSFARHLLKVVCGRLREAGTHIQTLAHGTIRYRVAKFLADQALFNGQLDGLTVRLPPLRAVDVSLMLSLERGHTTRAFKYFQSKKLIDWDDKGIVILNLQSLREMAQQVEEL